MSKKREAQKAILKIAKSKVRHYEKREYYGCLTPSEFLALVRAGIVAKKHDINRAKDDVKKGDGRPTWLYFSLGKMTLDQ